MRQRFLMLLCLILIALASHGFCNSLHAAAFESYQLRPELQFAFPDVTTPNNAQGATVFDVLGDGRIIAVLTQDADTSPQNFSLATPKLYLQSSIGSPTFDLLGDLPLGGNSWGDFGGSFIAVSPSGQKVAVGNNAGRVGIFSGVGLGLGAGVPAVTWFTVPEFSGAWYDDDQLALANFNTSNFNAEVALLDVTSTPATPTVKTLVTGLTGSSGVTFDTLGNLYTAEGFGNASQPTGQIRRFNLTDWQNAVTAGVPLQFSSGTEITTFSSSSSLEFDSEGSLIIGGGRFDAPPANSNALGVFRLSDLMLRTFDPNTANNEQGNFYATVYNPVTGEIYVNEPFALTFDGAVDSRTIHVITVVPEPSTVLLAMTALALLMTAKVGWPRKLVAGVAQQHEAV